MKKALLKFLFIALFIFPSFSGYSQEITWQRTIGGSDMDVLEVIRQTPDGGFICGGWSGSDISGDKTENTIGPTGFGDFWVVKLDSSGQIEWQRTLGGDHADYLSSIDLTSDGGYICGGTSTSGVSGHKTEVSRGYEDYWIVKLDSLGNIVWDKTIGGIYYDKLLSVIQTSDGGFICGGYSGSNASYDKTQDSRGHADYWIVKLNATGNIEWDKTIGGSQTDMLKTIIETPNGGIICTGHSRSDITGEKTENSFGEYDYWIVKLDAVGTILWQKTIGGSGDDQLFSGALSPDGYIIVGGYSYSNISGNKTDNTNGEHDAWIVKMDSTGNIVWQKSVGGLQGDVAYSVYPTQDGGVVCGGFSSSDLSGDKSENRLNSWCCSDAWIFKLNTQGLVLWDNTIGGDLIDYLMYVEQTANGDYILGIHSDSDISHDKNENSRGEHDYWILNLTERYNQINGSIYADLNQNEIQESNEPPIVQRKVIEHVTGRMGFSKQNGQYRISVTDSGVYHAESDLILGFQAQPQIQSVVFNGVNQIDSLNNFAYQSAVPVNNLCITITPVSPFRSGFSATYQINYENLGSGSVNATVKFYPDANVSYTGSSSTPQFIYSDSVEWNTGLLSPFQSGNFTVTVLINTALPIGSQINSSVKIEPIIGDDNPSCNVHSWEVFTTGSYDPNDILVNYHSLFSTQMSAPPFLVYTIRFQNTGNDTAFAVKILNPIDTTKLQLNTIEIINSSHPMSTQWIYHNRNMEFMFENILLPDSNVNEPESHGFVQYRIKPRQSLVAGDSIFNKAYIYFDFNDPVVTNDAVTGIILPTELSENPLPINFSLYPNPFNDELHIHLSQKSTIEMHDVHGRLVLSSTLEHGITRLNTSSLHQGIYFLKTGNAVKKVVKLN